MKKKHILLIFLIKLSQLDQIVLELHYQKDDPLIIPGNIEHLVKYLLFFNIPTSFLAYGIP